VHREFQDASSATARRSPRRRNEDPIPEAFGTRRSMRSSALRYDARHSFEHKCRDVEALTRRSSLERHRVPFQVRIRN